MFADGDTSLLIPEEAPQFLDDAAPHNGMIPPGSFVDWRALPLA